MEKEATPTSPAAEPEPSNTAAKLFGSGKSIVIVIVILRVAAERNRLSGVLVRERGVKNSCLEVAVCLLLVAGVRPGSVRFFNFRLKEVNLSVVLRDILALW